MSVFFHEHDVKYFFWYEIISHTFIRKIEVPDKRTEIRLHFYAIGCNFININKMIVINIKLKMMFYKP